jgi:hypothetical protein
MAKRKSRGNKAGSVSVKSYSYKKKGKRVKVKGYRRSAPGGKRGSQKK